MKSHVKFDPLASLDSCTLAISTKISWTWSNIVQKAAHMPFVPWADPEWGYMRFVPPSPLKNHKNIEFLSNTGPDPLKNHKAPNQHSMLVHHRPASETPFKWCFAGGSMMARLQWYLDPSYPHQLKKVVKVGPPLTKLSWSAHAFSFHTDLLFSDGPSKTLTW